MLPCQSGILFFCESNRLFLFQDDSLIISVTDKFMLYEINSVRQCRNDILIALSNG